MESSTTKQHDMCNLEQVCLKIHEAYDFLPEPTKKRLIVGAIEKSITIGDTQFFGTSPRAKKLKAIVELSQQLLLDDDRIRLVDEYVTNYVEEKKSQFQISTYPGGQSLQSAQIVPAPPQTSIPTALVGNALPTIDSATAVAPHATHVFAGEGGQSPITPIGYWPHSIEPSQRQLKALPISITNGLVENAHPVIATPPTYGHEGLTTMTCFDVYADSRHTNVAAAIDFLGPSISVVNTYIVKTDKSDAPKGWYVRNCKCLNKSCCSRIIVSSPSKELFSAPAKVRITFPTFHAAHDPPSWIQWYGYRIKNDTDSPEWDDTKYPRRPGLPCFLRLAVEELLTVNPHAQPAQASSAVTSRFCDHQLLCTPGKIRQMITRQVQALIRRLKNESSPCKLQPINSTNESSMGELKLPNRMEYTIDIWNYIDCHRVNYVKLRETKWQSKLVRGNEWLKEMALRLRDKGILSGLGRDEKSPETHLIVLDSDDVQQDANWQRLKLKHDTGHSTAQDPRCGTVVFSSLALLGNAVWCSERDWEVCATVDGSHGISKTSYNLITLAVLGFSASKRCRTFHPLVYIWGEGERELVAFHGFLNLKAALRMLFGIENICFKGGMVSDASCALVNAVKIAFPDTPLLSCYPHIIRKFKTDRKGNGGYSRYLKTQSKQWLTREGEKAIQRCSLCKTKMQKDLMWKLTKQKWEEDGESRMAETFAKTYIDNDDFSNWFYSASGRHGIVPCNNLTERYNLAMKGSSNFSGFIEIGLNMYTCLTREFVKLVEKSSIEGTCPSSEIPVVNLKVATNNNHFMEFQRLLDPMVDIKEYRGGWLINDWRYLLRDITDDAVTKMELALAGKLEESPSVEGSEDIRDVLLRRTQRFHFVTKALWSKGDEEFSYFQCDCRDYYYHRWCFPSAYMQHRDKFRLLGKKIPNRGSYQRKFNKTRQLAMALQEAAERKHNRDAERK